MSLPAGIPLFALRAGQSLFNFLVLALLAHRFSDVALADLLLLLSIIVTGARLGVFGLDVTLLAAYGGTKTKGAVFARSLAGFGLLWVPLAAGLWFARLPLMSPAVLLWLFLAALQVFQSSTLIALHRQRAGFLCGGVLSAGLVLLALLVLPTITLDGFIRLNIVALLANAAVAQGYIYHAAGGFGRPVAVGALLKTTLPALLTNVLLYTGAQLPLWFLVWVADDAAVVNYGLALRLTIALGLVLEVSRSLITPRFAQNFHRGTLKLAEPQLRRITTMAALATTTLALLGLGLLGPLFPVLFDRPAAPVVWITLWLFASQIALAVLGPAHMALRIGGQQPLALGLSLAAILALMAAMAALYPTFGANGIALAVFITTLGFALGNLALAKRYFHIFTGMSLRHGR